MPGDDQQEPRRTFTIHVCPECGYYDADPILRRRGHIRCFRCGKEAEARLDLRRVNRNYHHTRKVEARESAPLMVAVTVAPEQATRQSARAEALREVEPDYRFVIAELRQMVVLHGHDHPLALLADEMEGRFNLLTNEGKRADHDG